MSTKCYGESIKTGDIDKISKLSADDQLLWKRTKIGQLEVYSGNKLAKADAEDIPLVCLDAMLNVKSKIEDYHSITVSVSGGSDSDMVLDILARSTPRFREMRFVFFDTGLEYQATRDHLAELEQKYKITIERERAIKSIPLSCKEYGVPFLSKFVSECCYRLQNHGFKWEDKSYDELCKEYPKCKAALKWWCNLNGKGSQFNIDYHRCLKSYMIQNPPGFRISNKCCNFAKKKVAENYARKTDTDLNVTGVRKAERGIRASAYKSCLSDGNYRPIFWIDDKAKKEYADACHVKSSKCYTEYGLTRTGCCGCPYGRDFESELNVLAEYEPNLYRAVCTVFGKSYEYTRGYREYRKTHEM